MRAAPTALDQIASDTPIDTIVNLAGEPLAHLAGQIRGPIAAIETADIGVGLPWA